MNKSKIEWTDFSWNPVTGCYHPCEYCYARKMSKRFSGDVRLNLMDTERIIPYHSEGVPLYMVKEPFVTRNGRSLAYPAGFAPTFHEYRLDWPQKVKNGANIFVGSMCDLFGDWVPTNWIKQVYDACGAAPQHNYMFLTKNPDGYQTHGYIDSTNFWYGTSITSMDDLPKLERLPAHSNRFVSIEPLLGNISPAFEQAIYQPGRPHWIIIGAETGNRKNKVIPDPEWIYSIVSTADEHDIPVFMKDSLVPIIGEENMRRDFPAGLREKALSPQLTKKLYHHCGFCRQTFKKSDMYALLAREKRGAGAKAIGYACKECYETFTEGLGDIGES